MEGEQAVNPAPEVAAEEPQPEQAPAEAAAEEQPAAEEQAEGQPAAEEQPADADEPAAEPAAEEQPAAAEPAAEEQPAAGEPAAEEQPANGEPAAAAEAPAKGEQKGDAADGAAGEAGKEPPPAAPAAAAAPGSADGERRPSRPPQIFFNGAPPGVKRDEVEEVFGTYGKVIRVELLMDFTTRQTRGSGFIRYAEYQSAADAVAALHQNYTFPGGTAPMTVRWAGGGEQSDRKRKFEPREEGPVSEEDQRQLFLAKITRQIPEDAILAVLGQYGTVEHLRMFKPTPDAVYHKGCGVVTYSRKEEAEYAMRCLDEVYVWEGMREAMVAKYNESEHNKRRREEDMRSGPHYVSIEQPPVGCDMDALKLFVDGLPTSATAEDIRDVFKGFGRIIQILVARDKDTNEPKGSAYIWYQRRRDADFAARRMNGNSTAFAAFYPQQPAEVPLPAAEGEEAKPAEPAGPPKLTVKIAQSSVKALRRGERPPEWMRQSYGGPPGAPPLNMPPRGPPPGHGYMGGAPPPMGGGYGYGAPAAGGYGAPYGGPPMGAPQAGWGQQGGYGAAPGYGAPAGGYAGGYGAPPAAAPAPYGAPQQQAPPSGYQQAPPAAAPQPGYGQQPHQQPAGGYGQPAAQQGGYSPAAGVAPAGADYGAYYAQQQAPAGQPAAQAAPGQDYSAYYAQQQAGAPQQQAYGAYSQAPAAAAPAAGGYAAAPLQGTHQAQPVGGYASYAAPAAGGQQGAPAQQYGAPAQPQQGYGYGAPQY
ncbi:hypothetical protein ABPG75_008392 [Micractinium tetrahymenae]